jgi:hypothetical protein
MAADRRTAAVPNKKDGVTALVCGLGDHCGLGDRSRDRDWQTLTVSRFCPPEAVIEFIEITGKTRLSHVLTPAYKANRP